MSSSLRSKTHFVRQSSCRAGSRRWCAGSPWACRSSPRCRGCNSGCSLSSGSAGQSAEAFAISSCHQWSRPGVHRDRAAGPPVDDHVLEGRQTWPRRVGVLLERHDLAAPIAAVGRDQHLGLAVVVPTGERLGAEAAEDDRVRRPDPAQAEHRDHQLRHQRHVDRDHVARLDAEILEDVGEFRDIKIFGQLTNMAAVWVVN